MAGATGAVLSLAKFIWGEPSGTALACRRGVTAAQTVLRRDHRAPIEPAPGFGNRLFHLGRLGSHNSEITLRQLVCCRGGSQGNRKIVFAGNPQPITIQSPGMIVAPNQYPDFRHPCQVCRIQAPNRAAPDNAESLPHAQTYYRFVCRASTLPNIARPTALLKLAYFLRSTFTTWSA